MIPFKNRFHGHNSLDYVYKNGQTVRSRLANVKCTVNPKRSDSRVAVVVGKKVIKSAVKRNLIRRRVYEYVRLQISQFTKIFDVVIIISSSELMTMPHKDMVDMFDQLFSNVGIIKK